MIVPGEGEFARRCREAQVPCEVLPLPSLRSTSRRVTSADQRLPDPAALADNLLRIQQSAGVIRQSLSGRNCALLVTKGMGAHFSGALAARRLGIPCLWHLQDLVSERYAGLYARLFGLAATFLPTAVVADGSPILNQLPAKLRARSQVVFNGIDTDEFHPNHDAGGKSAAFRDEFSIPAGALVIGNAARLTAWKGQAHLLDAFLALAEAAPNTHLLLVGSALFDDDAYEQTLRRKVESSGYTKRITFTGFRSDLANVLRTMDIFAYPAREGYQPVIAALGNGSRFTANSQ